MGKSNSFVVDTVCWVTLGDESRQHLVLLSVADGSADGDACMGIRVRGLYIFQVFSYALSP